MELRVELQCELVYLEPLVVEVRLTGRGLGNGKVHGEVGGHAGHGAAERIGEGSPSVG